MRLGEKAVDRWRSPISVYGPDGQCAFSPIWRVLAFAVCIDGAARSPYFTATLTEVNTENPLFRMAKSCISIRALDEDRSRMRHAIASNDYANCMVSLGRASSAVIAIDPDSIRPKWRFEQYRLNKPSEMVPVQLRLRYKMIRSITKSRFPVFGQIVIRYDDDGYLPVFLYSSGELESVLSGKSDIHKYQLGWMGSDDPEAFCPIGGLLDPYLGKA